MAALPKTPCRRCGVAHANRNGYCNLHQALAIGWQQRQAGKTTKQRGYGYAWQLLCKTIKARDKFMCVLCATLGFVSRVYAVDHIIPKAQGGTDDPHNLQSICKACHKEKTQQESLAGRKILPRRGGGQKSGA